MYLFFLYGNKIKDLQEFLGVSEQIRIYIHTLRVNQIINFPFLRGTKPNLIIAISKNLCGRDMQYLGSLTVSYIGFLYVWPTPLRYESLSVTIFSVSQRSTNYHFNALVDVDEVSNNSVIRLYTFYHQGRASSIYWPAHVQLGLSTAHTYITIEYDFNYFRLAIYNRFWWRTKWKCTTTELVVCYHLRYHFDWF